ncbi:MAG: hypothetical protein GHCLOJNM_00338 [bacterium]|nr:hypothetical protein [bacterium]
MHMHRSVMTSCFPLFAPIWLISTLILSPSVCLSTPEIIGSLGGANTTLAVSGGYVYTAFGVHFTVLDVSDAAHPRFVTRLVQPEIITAIAVAGSRAYVGDIRGSVFVFDLANPADPTLLGSWTHPYRQRVKRIRVRGSHAFVSSDIKPLATPFLVLDVSDPGNPTGIAMSSVGAGAEDFLLEGDLAYLADSSQRLVILDISTPQGALPMLGWVDTPQVRSNYRACLVKQGTHVVLQNRDRLFTIDVSNPASPVVVTVTDQNVNRACRCEVLGEALYVADDALRAYDFSHSATPFSETPFDLGVLDYPNLKPVDMVLDATTLWTANEYDGIQGIDVTHPGSPELLGQYSEPAWARSILLAGNVAYVGGGNGWGCALWAVDITDLSVPRVTSFTRGSISEVDDLDISGDRLYAAAAHGFGAFDTSHPTDPILVGGNLGSGQANAVEIVGSYLYEANWGISIYDIDPPLPPFGTPIQPLRQGLFATAIYDMDQWGNRLVLIGHDKVWLLQATNPLHPTDLGSVQLVPSYSLQHVSMVGSQVYVAAGYDFLGLDFSDPGNPALLSQSHMDSFLWGLHAEEALVWLAGGSGGLLKMDVSDPQHPVLVDQVFPPGFQDSYRIETEVRCVEQEGDLVGFGSRDHGVAFFLVSGDSQSVTETPEAQPSPANTPQGIATFDLDGNGAINAVDLLAVIGEAKASKEAMPCETLLGFSTVWQGSE